MLSHELDKNTHFGGQKAGVRIEGKVMTLACVVVGKNLYQLAALQVLLHRRPCERGNAQTGQRGAVEEVMVSVLKRPLSATTTVSARAEFNRHSLLPVKPSN